MIGPTNVEEFPPVLALVIEPLFKREGFILPLTLRIFIVLCVKITPFSVSPVAHAMVRMLILSKLCVEVLCVVSTLFPRQ